MSVAGLMRAVPIDLCVVGRKRDYILRALDIPFRRRSMAQLHSEFGTFAMDLSHDPERALFYCLHNMLRYYDRSDLGQYISARGVAGSTFLDIGANLGIYSLLARRAGMQTVVVEPDPQHARFLERNAAIFGTVAGVAVSNAPGELPLYYDSTNPAGTSLCDALGYVRGTGTVPVRTFSALAAEGIFGRLERIGLIKIDVEGFEVEAVEGMAAAFADPTFRPGLWVEVRGDTAGRAAGSFRRVRSLLEGHGYATRWVRNGNDLVLDGAAMAHEQVYDLLFTA
jgi:FkbM family methyltransferase